MLISQRTIQRYLSNETTIPEHIWKYFCLCFKLENLITVEYIPKPKSEKQRDKKKPIRKERTINKNMTIGIITSF